MSKAVLGLMIILGALLFANGLYMVTFPQTWFFSAPGVSRTGLFNQHLVRDLGMLYILIGAAFVKGAFEPDNRVALWGFAAIWLTGHALFHFTEVAVGLCGPRNLAIDFPGVTLPALISIVATVWAWHRRRPASRRI